MIAPLLLLGAAAAPAADLPPPVQRDLQCFILFAIDVSDEKEEAAKQGASLGLMYFYAKLRAEVRSGDLVQAIRQEADSIGDVPDLKSVGQSCDTEFQQVGKELRDLGADMQTAGKVPTT